MHDDVHIRRRNLPQWERAGSTYFLTFRLRSGELISPERSLVLRHVLKGDLTFYDLAAAIVMPDHVHLILRPNEGIELARIMKGIKGASARLVNQHRGTHGSIWQDESFDRILRNEDEYLEKWDYIRDNAATKGLVDRAENYPHLFLRDRR